MNLVELKIGFMPGYSRNNMLTFLMALVLNAYFMFIGISNSLGEYHAFRQSQTAISAYYLAENGFSANYETPVMGEPWAIPLEFPLHQYLSAMVFKLDTGLSPDESGRLVSILFFYLSLVPLYLISAKLLAGSERTLQFIALFLAAPTYIFWSRAFMVESAAFFFGIMSIWLVIKYNQDNKLYLLLLLALAASLCGLVKLTTWVLMSVPILIAIFSSAIKNGKPVLNPPLVYKITAGIVIPYVICYSWTIHAESIRNLNPMAALVFARDKFLLWNFGTIGLKLLVIAASIAGFALIRFLSKRNPYRKIIFACFASFAAGPVIFTNLYLVHDYYFYANLVFLIFTVYLLILPLIEGQGKRSSITGRIMYLSVFVLFIGVYLALYLPVQRSNNKSILEFAEKIKSSTDKNDILLIYGHDWNSLIPYYSERRAIMDRFDLSIKKASLLKIFNEDNRNSIKAMIVKKEYMLSEDFIKERTGYFGLDSLPVYVDSTYGAVYLKTGAKQGAGW